MGHIPKPMQGKRKMMKEGSRDREKEGDRERERDVRRYSPKRHEEVPGGRAFLTSTFCFRKAAN